MSDLTPETEQLLELARGASVLTGERRAQLKAGLFAQIAAGGLAAQVAAGSASAGKAAWLTGPVAKLISALALVSVAGAGVYVGLREHERAPQSARAQSAQNTPLESAPPVPVATASDDSVSAPPALASAAASPSAAAIASAVKPLGGRAPSAAAADTLVDETRLLRDADQALRAGNAQRALSLLNEHAAQYPRGVLAPERNAERMIARCQLGQGDATSARAYLAAHPDSAFTARIRDACTAAK